MLQGSGVLAVLMFGIRDKECTDLYIQGQTELSGIIICSVSNECRGARLTINRWEA